MFVIRSLLLEGYCSWDGCSFATGVANVLKSDH